MNNLLWISYNHSFTAIQQLTTGLERGKEGGREVGREGGREGGRVAGTVGPSLRTGVHIDRCLEHSAW